ncbi:hypothetical protein CAPTEDRAFT_224362 [Capitella teleta]|uniref:Uncharacterized protein n=1 Tax=Capitella teleta TaxID=283909 RepID=R7TIQ1_CAPTE|nr:hypothetical protein CAPTEDRAFT_224362 [Capitella teleta]|eukprot:ELT93337.1 hypothetical protein CAPTEDRAFT_224362 [Capitella teleta]
MDTDNMVSEEDGFEITPSLTNIDPGSEEHEAPPTYDQAMMEAAMASAASPLPSASGLYPSLPVACAPGGPPVGPSEVGGPLTYVTFTQGPFNALVEQANGWLEQHPEYRFLNCETLEIPRENDGHSFGDCSTINNVSSFNLRLASNVQFIRTFRLWVVPQTPGTNQKPQRIAYTDIIPKKRASSTALFFKPKVEFESLKDTLLRCNHGFRTEPLPGRVLSIQTLEVLYRDELRQSGAPPCFERFQENYFTWVREKNDSPEYFRLTYLRVYYEETPCAVIQQIGFKDFVPKQCEDGKDFEPLEPSVVRIQSWLNENEYLDVANVQTVEYAFNKSPNSKFTAETDRTLFRVKDICDLRGLKFFRVFFLQYLNADAGIGPLKRPRTLTYKTFNPAVTARQSKTDPEQFENNMDSWTRSSCWLRLTGARIFGAETVMIRTYPSKGNSNLQIPFVLDSSFRNNRGADWNETWVITHRVFLDGLYAEPPANLMPPLPFLPPDDSGSCAIL